MSQRPWTTRRRPADSRLRPCDHRTPNRRRAMPTEVRADVEQRPRDLALLPVGFERRRGERSVLSVDRDRGSSRRRTPVRPARTAATSLDRRFHLAPNIGQPSGAWIQLTPTIGQATGQVVPCHSDHPTGERSRGSRSLRPSARRAVGWIHAVPTIGKASGRRIQPTPNVGQATANVARPAEPRFHATPNADRITATTDHRTPNAARRTNHISHLTRLRLP